MLKYIYVLGFFLVFSTQTYSNPQNWERRMFREFQARDPNLDNPIDRSLLQVLGEVPPGEPHEWFWEKANFFIPLDQRVPREPFALRPGLTLSHLSFFSQTAERRAFFEQMSNIFQLRHMPQEAAVQIIGHLAAVRPQTYDQYSAIFRKCKSYIRPAEKEALLTALSEAVKEVNINLFTNQFNEKFGRLVGDRHQIPLGDLVRFLQNIGRALRQ
jgi:hypothetical protein